MATVVQVGPGATTQRARLLWERQQLLEELEDLDEEIADVEEEREVTDRITPGCLVEVIAGPYDGLRGTVTYRCGEECFVRLDGYSADYRFVLRQLAPTGVCTACQPRHRRTGTKSDGLTRERRPPNRRRTQP